MTRGDRRELFDLDYWTSIFPLDNYSCAGCTVCGPSDVARIEQIRQLAGGQAQLGPNVATDIFVLGKGEPLQRDVTKVGGLPFRPRDAKWPATLKGRAMTFLAQYQFADSKDLTGPIPGDILLVFVTDDYLYTGGGEIPFFFFEWYSKDTTDLANHSDVPQPPKPFVNCFGVRHRSVDYLDDQRASAAIQCAATKKNLDVTDEYTVLMTYRFNGIKIGGDPVWLKNQRPLSVTKKWRFLCSLTEIMPDCDVEFPWINDAKAIPIPNTFRIPNQDVLYWYEGFTSNFFLDEDGNVRAETQLA